LQLGECGFIVVEGGVGLLEDAHGGPFCGVGEGLDLVGNSGVVSLLAEGRKGGRGRGTVSYLLAVGRLGFLRAVCLFRLRRRRLCRAFLRRRGGILSILGWIGRRVMTCCVGLLRLRKRSEVFWDV